MTAQDDDPLTAGLAALAVDGPPGLLERIAATWTRTPGPTCDLYIASTDRGVVYVRTSDAVHHDDAEFETLFHRRFARPLVRSGRSPDRLRLDLSRLSAFEREVLLAVLAIPRGQVRPYDWIGHQIGRPTESDAIDTALTDNPIPVLVPCHRVINSDGTLGNYVFGRFAKRALLEAEGTNLGEVSLLARLDIHYVASEVTGAVCFPTCPNARRTKQAHRHGFPTVTDARAAGYRPCPACGPVPDEAG